MTTGEMAERMVLQSSKQLDLLYDVLSCAWESVSDLDTLDLLRC
jgi:hypothetical protein